MIFLAMDLGSVSFGAGTENLLDYRGDTYWRSSTGSTQALVLTRSVVESVDAIGIAGANFDELGGSVTLQGASDSAFTSPTTLFTFSSSSDTSVYTFSSSSLAYLRLHFTTPIVRPRIAQVYIGTALALDPYLPPFQVENVSSDTISAASLVGNTRTSRRMDPRVVASVRFDYQTEATRSAFAAFVESVRGRGRPFFFRNHEGVARFVRFAVDYNPVDIRGHNLNAIQTFTVRTQETSALWSLGGSGSGGAMDEEFGPLPDLKFIL